MIEHDDENKKPAGEKKGLDDARRKARDPVKPRYPSTGRPSRGDRRTPSTRSTRRSGRR